MAKNQNPVGEYTSEETDKMLDFANRWNTIFATLEQERPLRSSYVPHKPVLADTVGPSMTRQEFAEECDINTLMDKYESLGQFPMPQSPPAYLDLTELPDFQSAQNAMIVATEAFMTLPAKVRKEFDNDPGRFVDFAEKPENLDQMRAWGLAPPAAEPPSAPYGSSPERPLYTAATPVAEKPEKG